MFNKNIIIKIVFFAFIVMFFVATTGISSAKVLYNSDSKDSDFDGLTDQGEIQIFGTNPNNPDTDGDGYLDSAEVISGTDPRDPNDPSKDYLLKETGGIRPRVTQNTVYDNRVGAQNSAPWTWYFIRGSGLTAYMLLFLLIVSGIGIKTSLSYNILSPENAWSTHRMLGISLLTMIATHLVSILFDGFIKFSVIDVFVPFATNFRSFYVGIGIIGFYMFLGIIITSLFYFKKAPKLWRLLHYLTYPTFVLLLLHGIYTGTDTPLTLVQLMYWVTGLIVVILTSYRISLKIVK